MDREHLQLVMATAARAPSVHNTQPWRFTVTAGGALEVHTDRDRQLTTIDPSARQLLVSCGGAVEFARLAIRAAGYVCAVDVMPASDEPDLVAVLTPGVASPATLEELALTDAIGRRHTDRGPYDDTQLPPGLLDELRDGVERYGMWLRHIDLPVDRVIVVGALSDSERRLAADPSYAEELDRWTSRPGHSDGLADAPPVWPRDRVSDVPLRDFSGRGLHRRTESGAPPVVERDTLVLLGSVGDDGAAHVATGRAVAWLLLRITVSGLAGQPLGQAFDDVSGRVRLGSDLRLIGYPQFLLRLGYGHEATGTARRSVEDAFHAP